MGVLLLSSAGAAGRERCDKDRELPEACIIPDACLAKRIPVNILSHIAIRSDP